MTGGCLSNLDKVNSAIRQDVKAGFVLYLAHKDVKNAEQNICNSNDTEQQKQI